MYINKLTGCTKTLQQNTYKTSTIELRNNISYKKQQKDKYTHKKLTVKNKVVSNYRVNKIIPLLSTISLRKIK
jgi:hypothetical protein